MDITKEELQILVAKDEKPRRTSYIMILWGILDVGLFCAFCFGIVYFAILIIVSAVFLPGGFAGAGRLLWAAAVCAVGGMAGGMTAHGR